MEAYCAEQGLRPENTAAMRRAAGVAPHVRPPHPPPPAARSSCIRTGAPARPRRTRASFFARAPPLPRVAALPLSRPLAPLARQPRLTASLALWRQALTLGIGDGGNEVGLRPCLSY